jgi:hypothetical protein
MAAPLQEKAEAFSVRGSGPQGLRRPRFSFFRFTCQTSRSLTTPSPVHRSRRSPHIRHGHGAGRMIHRINSEGLRGRVIAPRRRRVQRPYIGFGSRHCQPPASQNTYFESITPVRRPLCAAHQPAGPELSMTPANPAVKSGPYAALRPHSSAVLAQFASGNAHARGSATKHSALISTVQSP